jgi:hypothetical protein
MTAQKAQPLGSLGIAIRDRFWVSALGCTFSFGCTGAPEDSTLTPSTTTADVTSAEQRIETTRAELARAENLPIYSKKESPLADSMVLWFDPWDPLSMTCLAIFGPPIA